MFIDPASLATASAQILQNLSPIVRRLGYADFEPTLRAMQSHNKARNSDTRDEIWLVEHAPVFTLGMAGKLQHVLNSGDIAVVKTDRGGQVTYHGPGQIVCYVMLDLRRLGYGVKALVRRMEAAVIALLGEYAIAAHAEPAMPGAYVRKDGQLAKISAIGLRVANHATYHGVSLNVDMDLEPFSRINPCGYAGLMSAQMSDYQVSDSMQCIADKLAAQLINHVYGK